LGGKRFLELAADRILLGIIAQATTQYKDLQIGQNRKTIMLIF
jgi:hypothetical protein